MSSPNRRQTIRRQTMLSDMTPRPGWRDPTPRFVDHVVVELAVAGDLDRVGRPLHRAERVAVAEELVRRARGGEVNLTHIERVCGVSYSHAAQLVAEARARLGHATTD